MKQLEEGINSRIIRLTLFLCVLASLPHVWHLPISISLFTLGLIIWRFSALSIPRLIPGRLMLGLITVFGVLLVYSQHQTLLGRDAGVSLLTLMLTLKLMELGKRRDIYVICFIGYFIILTQFLYNQSIAITLYLLGTLVCLTALLVEINRITPSKNFYQPLKATLVIGIQAIPIAAVLFILFPRIGSPLWNLGSSNTSGLSGLDDRVSPGSISQLIQSPAVAFRANFFGLPPRPEDRYWRGMVLWDTDGFDWYNKTTPLPRKDAPMLLNTGQRYSYQISLEPHDKKWLFSLDLPSTAPAGSHLTRDYLLISHQTVNSPRSYRSVSFSRYVTERPTEQDLLRGLTLPGNVTQRQRDLVKSWKSRAVDKQDIVSLALQHFHSQPYVYTLSPPLYQQNPIDQFLFEGMEGFCEHFASSFTQLMRIAGIPARIVIGYQGGEYNPLGDYFIIRQSDAHAWSEVWLDKAGWLRVDPTAAVAPERIRHSLQLDFSEIGSPALFQIESGDFLTSIYYSLGLVLDAANIGWRQWILGYNQGRQSNLLNSMGLNFTQNWEWTGLMFVIIGLFLLLTTTSLTLKGRLKQQPVVKSYQKLCKKLARIGLTRDLSEGPLNYSKRVATQRPDLSVQTNEIFQLYIKIRYTESVSKSTIQAFQRLVRNFRPSRYSD